jgi:histidine ammonia-lyase
MSVQLDGKNLNLDELWRIAVESEPVEVSPQALERVEAARKIVEKAVQEGRIVYGVTTGFGKLSDVQISPEKASQLQVNLLRSHACGTGPEAPLSVVRAIMALKVNNLLRGHSGVRVQVIKLLVEMLNRGIHPVIPAKGSVGASGDLAPLAHMSLVLIGEGEAVVNGERLPGRKAMEKAGLAPLQLAEKEGLSLINGTQYMTAVGALGVYRAERLAKIADIIAAMTTDGLKGTPVAFDPRIQEVRGQEGQKKVARNLVALLEHSEIRRSHMECKKVQDAYSIRCTPQVHGAVRDAVGFVRTIFERELNAVTDNPLIFPDEGEILSGGNFHGEPVALALDFLAIAMAELGNISERRIAMLMDSNFSELPDFLTPRPGLNSGFMIAQVTAAALASENKGLAHPASVDSIPTSANKEDFVSMGPNAANKLWQVLENLERILAIEALAAAQALDLRAPLQSGKGVNLALTALRNKVPFLDHDRFLAPEIEKAAELIRSFELLKSVEKEVQLL